MGERVWQEHQATVSLVRGRLTVSYFGDSRDLTPVGPHPPRGHVGWQGGQGPCRGAGAWGEGSALTMTSGYNMID